MAEKSEEKLKHDDPLQLTTGVYSSNAGRYTCQYKWRYFVESVTVQEIEYGLPSSAGVHSDAVKIANKIKIQQS